MTGAVVPMYSLKPVVETNCVFNYNSSMYMMKSLVDSELSLQEQTGSEDNDVYVEVERSQAIIFDYIKVIKKQVQELKQILLKRCSQQTTEKVEVSNEMLSVKHLDNSGVTHEVVINADINNPPYSLLVLHHLTKQIISLKITSHFHSTLNVLPEILNKFNSVKCTNINGNPVLNIRLIWKDGGGTSVVLGHVPLSGEVSLLRFVHSCLGDKLNASDDTKLQQILDDLNNSGSSSFESSLKGNKHLIADRLTVGDIALWSSLKRSPNTKLQQWFQHFDKLLAN